MAVVELESVSFEYATVPGAGVREVDLTVEAGEIVVVCGPSGSGKSTVTRIVNGLVPNFFEGTLSGRISVGGVDVPQAPITQVAELTGSVFQDPRTQFFTGDTTSELAFGPENLGWDPALIQERIDAVSASLRLAPLLDRSILALSGGEQQRLACAVASMTDPVVLLLDEPSSTLDGAAVGTLTEALREWKSAGKAILVAEHRLDYLAGIADRFVYFDKGRVTGRYTRDEFLALGPARWEELGLRSPLSSIEETDGSFVSACQTGIMTDGGPGSEGSTPPRSDHREVPGIPPPVAAAQTELSLDHRGKKNRLHIAQVSRPSNLATDSPDRLHLEGVRVKRGGRVVLSIDEVDLLLDQPLAIVGANGSGKSTLARWLAGLGQARTGIMDLDGQTLKPPQRLDTCYLVAQNTNHQLFSDTVLGEILLASQAQRTNHRHHARIPTPVTLPNPPGVIRPNPSDAIVPEAGSPITSPDDPTRHIPPDVIVPNPTPVILPEAGSPTSSPEEAAAHRILKDLDLDQMAHRHPLTLSGGERQRLVIAVAMASNRRVVILDEPTSGLDATHMRQVAAGIHTLRDAGAAVIVVTHDADLVALTCGAAVRLADGQVTEQYPLDEQGLARVHAMLAPTPCGTTSCAPASSIPTPYASSTQSTPTQGEK